MNKRIDRKMNDEFAERLAKHFYYTYSIVIDTSFNIFTSSLVTTRVDGNDMTPEQLLTIRDFEAGYLAARAAAEDAS